MRDPRRRLPLAVQKHHLLASVRTKADFAPKSRSNDCSLWYIVCNFWYIIKTIDEMISEVKLI